MVYISKTPIGVARYFDTDVLGTLAELEQTSALMPTYYVSEKGIILKSFADKDVAARSKKAVYIEELKQFLKTIGSSAKKDNGYVKYTQAGNRNQGYLHRLVALCFVENPDNKPYVRHIDSNKLNNHYSNLKWCYQKDTVLERLSRGEHTSLSFEQLAALESELRDTKVPLTTLGKKYFLSVASLYSLITSFDAIGRPTGRVKKSRANTKNAMSYLL